MTNTFNNFEMNGKTYTNTANGYYWVTEDSKKSRVSKAAYIEAWQSYLRWTTEMAEQEAAEEAFENAATDEMIDNAFAEVQQMLARGEVVEYTGNKMPEYKGNYFPVRGGSWADPMNSCFYTVVDTIRNYEICHDHSTGEMFAIHNLNAEDAAPEATACAPLAEEAEQAPEAAPAPKAKKKAKRAKKDVAYTIVTDGKIITLTEKQVDFIKHLPDTCFWEDGVDSAIWVDCLCDDIGGQFEGKPMTVGAMISTICEKGLGTRGTERRNGRKCTCFALTDLGKVVAKDLGL